MVDVSRQIIAQAESSGADIAGIANLDRIKKSPSHSIFSRIGMQIGGVGSGNLDRHFEIQWFEKAKSALVIAIQHPKDAPELDWWTGRGTPGNDRLIRINKSISTWIQQELGIVTHPLAYHLEAGGIFLKDAAVHAGIGCIGINNMLLTQDFGPRIRLRAMLLDAELPATGPLDFDPCPDCPQPCRKACPQHAYDQLVYSPDRMGIANLPGRDGCYDRSLCNIQMIEDESGAEKRSSREGDQRVVKYCRRCEFACPVGR